MIHQFIAEFQPIAVGTSLPRQISTLVLNYAALFCVFFVIGYALRLGLGL